VGECKHQGFHSVSSRYDRGLGILAFILTCEHCGAELRELQRESYLPQFDPHGNERAASAGREETEPVLLDFPRPAFPGQ
jgi:hypothetical protein